jgi:hypothetical protein
MKTKNLKKKLRRLDAKLQEAQKELSSLRRKLETQITAEAAGRKRKAKTRITRRPPRAATGASERSLRSSASTKAKPVLRRPSSAKKKRTLNLSPERRAQLADAMRARWAARKAAAAGEHGVLQRSSFRSGPPEGMRPPSNSPG